MTRYWASWWTKDGEGENLPFDAWISGERTNFVDASEDAYSYVAMIDAPSEDDLWRGVARYFPDYEPRFCNPKPDNWQPEGDRFQGGEGKASLV